MFRETSPLGLGSNLSRPTFASLDLLVLHTRALFYEKAYTAEIIDIAGLIRRLRAISVSKSTKVVLKANIGANQVLNY
jgi:hypothetical protein